MWLLTIPAKNENINNNVHAATTEIIDGHEYAVLDVYQENSGNDIVGAFLQANTYAKLVLQEDIMMTSTTVDQLYWHSTATGHMIVELNGHQISFGGRVWAFSILTNYIQIRDSSPQGTGRITGCTLRFYNTNGDNVKSRIDGGLIERLSFFVNGIKSTSVMTCDIYGGTVNNIVSYNATNANQTTVRIYGGRVDNYGAAFANVFKVVDGIDYKLIYLKGNSDPEQTKAIFNGSTSVNYYYIFTDDWDMVANKVGWGNGGQMVYGQNIILDLNGHSVRSIDTSGGGYYLRLQCTNLEITNSSVADGSISFVELANSPNIIVSGNITTQFVGYSVNACQVTIRGAKSVAFQDYNSNFSDSKFTVAPYMVKTADSGLSRTYKASHEAYAVSASNSIVSGICNYEFGAYAWELTVGELSKLDVPTDKTYYLWGRNADGAYEYLNIQYFDGQWTNVAWQSA